VVNLLIKKNNMPAPPTLNYVLCPDGSTAIGGENCGSNVSLNEQIHISLEKQKNDPIRLAALKAEKEAFLNSHNTDAHIETTLGNGLTSSQKWMWLVGLTLAAWGILYYTQKQK
jgi:hypothetical protein